MFPARISIFLYLFPHVYVPHCAAIMNTMQGRHHLPAVPGVSILVERTQQRSLVEVHRVVEIRRLRHDLPSNRKQQLCLGTGADNDALVG